MINNDMPQPPSPKKSWWASQAQRFHEGFQQAMEDSRTAAERADLRYAQRLHKKHLAPAIKKYLRYNRPTPPLPHPPTLATILELTLSPNATSQPGSFARATLFAYHHQGYIPASLTVQVWRWSDAQTLLAFSPHWELVSAENKLFDGTILPGKSAIMRYNFLPSN